MPAPWEMDWSGGGSAAVAEAEAPPWKAYQRADLLKEQNKIRLEALADNQLLGMAEAGEFVTDAASKMLTAFPRAAHATSQLLGLTPRDVPYEATGLPVEGRPLISGDIITPPERGNNPIGQAMTGVAKAAADVGGFLTTPEGVATAGAAGAGGKLGQAALTSIFAGIMAHGLPEASAQYGEKMAEAEKQLANGEEPDLTEFVRSAANLAASGYFVGHPLFTGARAELPQRWNEALEPARAEPPPWKTYAKAEEQYPEHRSDMASPARTSAERRPEIPAGEAESPWETYARAEGERLSAERSPVAEEQAASAARIQSQNDLQSAAGDVIEGARAAEPAVDISTGAVAPDVTAETVPPARAQETRPAAPVESPIVDRVSEATPPAEGIRPPPNGINVSAEQWNDMAQLNEAQQLAKYGTSRARLFEEAMTSKPRKPVETPAAAVAKVAEHVAEVASGEKVVELPKTKGKELIQAATGPRPAKEIKSELVTRVEREIAKLPARPELLYTDPKKVNGKREFYVFSPDKSQRVRVRESFGDQWSVESEKISGKTGLLSHERVGSASGDIRAATRAAESAVEKLISGKTGSVTINIPGDGSFTVDRTHAALREMLRRVEALDTRSSAGRPKVLSGGSNPANFKRFTEEEWADPKIVQTLEALLKGEKSESQRRLFTEALRQARAIHGVQEPVGNQISSFGGGNAARAPRSPGAAPASAAPLRQGSNVRNLASSPPPALGPLRQHLANSALSLKSLFAPASIDAGARDMANTLRHNLGTAALHLDQAEASLHKLRNEFDHTPVPQDYTYDPSKPLPYNYKIIDDFERNRSALPARYQEMARIFDQAFADRIAVIRKFAPNALQHLITDYFPHVWTDPVRAKDVMAQLATRNFQGRKEFLKERTLATFREGIERGLKPISDNPVDLLLAKMHSMDKFIVALKTFEEGRQNGSIKFKYLFERLPDDHVIVDDPAFVVQKPPVVTVKEAYDEFQRAKLMELLQHLGVSYQRLESLGGKALAMAYQGTREIKARVGASEDMLWHEAGHHFDYQFKDLRDFFDLRGNSPEADQLRTLGDLRGGPKAYTRKSSEKMAEVVRAYVHAPEVFKSTAPLVWKQFNAWLDVHPDIRQKLDAIKPSMRFEQEATDLHLGGMQLLGNWIMPAGPAQVVKNYLSPGLSQSGIYRSLRQASNLLNGAQLGLSAFHLGFTSLDAAVSRLAVALEDMARGKVGAAVKTFATVPVSPLTNIITGHRIKAEALHPGTHPELAPIVRALEQAGGRVGNDRMWQTEFTRRMVRAWHEGGAQWATLPLRIPLAAWEQTMRPILEYVVPRQKLGVFADLARREIEKLPPNADVAQSREAMRKAWDSVDNRMGQVVYSNLFMNRVVKDVALMTFRAYGWQLGKYREGLGAMADTGTALKAIKNLEKPELSHRMAYAMALPIMVGTIGATMHYLFNGKPPEDPKDYFMPRTGEIDRNGNPVRLHLPSYLKDVISYGKHPITSFGHSLNPLWAGINELLSNKDFYDVQIRNPDDPIHKQAGAVAEHLAKQFVPFAVSGAMKLNEEDAPAWKQIAPFFGLTPVPARITMSPAQELASEITAASMPSAPRTREQYDKAKLMKDIVKQIKSGDVQGGRGALAGGMQAGIINPDAVHTMIEKLKYDPLQFQVHHMNAEAAMRVYRLANDQEKARLKDILMGKVANAQTLTPDQKRAFARELGE